MWPMFVAGMALNLYGQYSANQAQAAAEDQNTEFFEAQAKYAEFAGARERKIFADKASYERGQQISAIAASGVDLTSQSALEVIAGQSSNALDELNAIDVKNALDVRLARARAGQSRDKAAGLRDPMNMFYSGGGTILTSSASMLNSSSKSDRGYGSNYSTGRAPAKKTMGGSSYGDYGSEA